MEGKGPEDKMIFDIRPVGKLNGVESHIYYIKNGQGDELEILDYGLVLLSWKINLGHELRDILLGYHDLNQYVVNDASFNCIIGRYANRIAFGKFEIQGTPYQVSRNLGEHHLHGGEVGFGNKHWKLISSDCQDTFCALTFILKSPNGDQGFPGNLDVTVKVRFTNQNEIIFEHVAETDQACPVNLTNHAYFNLGNEKTIYNHSLQIHADKITETNKDLIPTGNLKNVTDTIFDFRELSVIDWRNHKQNKELEHTNGYDQNFVLNQINDYQNKPAALAINPDSDLKLEVFTNKSGLQLYTGNWLKNVSGKGGELYVSHAGFCLEAQDFPDAPNHPNFPDTILREGEKYYHYLKYKISRV